MQLCSPIFFSILAPEGSAHGVGMPKLAKLVISGGRPGLAFVAILSSQALIHGS